MLSSLDVDHTEWVQLTLSQAREVGRVDLYPRGDPPYAGTGFPANFTVELLTGTGWTTVVSRTGYPPPATNAVQRFTFPARTATAVRVTGTALRVLQFAEIEAYRR